MKSIFFIIFLFPFLFSVVFAKDQIDTKQVKETQNKPVKQEIKKKDNKVKLLNNGILTFVKDIRGSKINSPKSAIFSPDGKLFYVQALEGFETLVFDASTYELNKIIKHHFTEKNAYLFVTDEDTLFDYKYNTNINVNERNCFSGKPVESAFSHNGRFLWVSYYRRDWDKNSSNPSAIAIIDTNTNEIVRVIPSGPIPKMIVPSPDGKKMAVIHWGDNSVGILNIDFDDPSDFVWEKLLISDKRLNLKGISENRDKQCGHCLRGAIFTKDSKYLFVGRMRSGGIIVFDIENGNVLGILNKGEIFPRHFALSPNGQYLYVSSPKQGVIIEYEVDELLYILKQANGVAAFYKGLEIQIGAGVRTIALSNNGKYLYAACNADSKLVMVDIRNWKVISKINVAPYAVGLGINPTNDIIVVTSQGNGTDGGRVISIFKVNTDKLGKKLISDK